MNQTTTNDKYSLAERLKRVKKTRWIRFSIVALLYIGLAKQLLCIARPVATHRHLSHPIYSVGVVENQ